MEKVKEDMNSLDDLLKGVYGAVIDAQNLVEQHYIREINKDFFNEDGSPKTIMVQLPGPSGDLQKYPLPVATLVPNNFLAIDKLKIKTTVCITPHDDDDTKSGGSRIKRFFTDFGSKRSEGNEPTTVEISFKGGNPPEGLARVKDKLIKLLPT